MIPLLLVLLDADSIPIRISGMKPEQRPEIEKRLSKLDPVAKVVVGSFGDMGVELKDGATLALSDLEKAEIQIDKTLDVEYAHLFRTKAKHASSSGRTARRLGSSSDSGTPSSRSSWSSSSRRDSSS